MAALVSEIKSRQAAKAAKQRTSAPVVGSLPSVEEGDPSSSSVRAGPVGGIMLGERGKVMIREKQSAGEPEGKSSAESTGKGNGSWFGGRI